MEVIKKNRHRIKNLMQYYKNLEFQRDLCNEFVNKSK